MEAVTFVDGSQKDLHADTSRATDPALTMRSSSVHSVSNMLPSMFASVIQPTQ
jgi:hypothetical protein